MEIPTKKRLTYEEFRELEFDDNDCYWYELINGKLVRKNTSTLAHQNISGNILMAMKPFVRQKDLGIVVIAPLDTVLDDCNSYHPDLLFIKKERYRLLLHEKYQVVFGAPDLVVEILSNETAFYDRGEKKDKYEMYGVREYWLIDQKSKVVEIYGFEQQRFKLMQYQEETGTVTSTVLTGFQMELDEIFQTD